MRQPDREELVRPPRERSAAWNDRSDRAMSELERRTVERVRRAAVKAPESAMLAWVRSVGPEVVLGAALADIRAVANAF